jgi:hypothetical protein
MRRPNFSEKSGIELGLQAIVIAHVLYLVPLAGIEPALLAELDFESSASTNSATGAMPSRVSSDGAPDHSVTRLRVNTGMPYRAQWQMDRCRAIA